MLSLYDDIPLAVIYNKYLGTSTNIFTQPLADCVDSTGTPFDVNSFILFAEVNLGFDTYGGGCGGGGCNTSPFEYNSNLSGIQPILGSNNASGTLSTIGGGARNEISGFNSYKSTISGGSQNCISGQCSVGSTIGGGVLNTITDSACSSILGGFNNNINHIKPIFNN